MRTAEEDKDKRANEVYVKKKYKLKIKNGGRGL